MAVGDKEKSFIISGTGDVLEPEGDVIGIGSGGNYALASAKVLAPSPVLITKVSIPLPPVKVSVPVPPSRVSLPAFPTKISLPAPP